MRVSPARRRRWNNILILGIIAFIVLLNAPAWIKMYLLPDDAAPYPSLLRSDHTIRAIYFHGWELAQENGQWTSSVKAEVPLAELVQRWQSLQGTELSAEQYQTLRPRLTRPESIEVWYQGMEEPQRVTFYRMGEFWLFKNWQDKWIAISVDGSYLMPD
ncbi:hypothetical protein [Vibrio sp. CAU 1672]|uniref:hypothetical protein n=1 Tax=Vibrio sp. CAU 1672 TaxID=3032594 RepID=UPI0023DC4F15|nr:hypothetical protein [Vibrio sp. CAU 1672]MDF2153943.1 hypothetical protein [Vibrio sp. CAU 1672]